MSEPKIWSRDEIDSPCVRVCVVHPDSGICVGCLRTPDEIASWTRMSPDQRREIMANLSTRAPQLTQRRGGRRARLARD